MFSHRDMYAIRHRSLNDVMVEAGGMSYEDLGDDAFFWTVKNKHGHHHHHNHNHDGDDDDDDDDDHEQNFGGAEVAAITLGILLGLTLLGFCIWCIVGWARRPAAKRVNARYSRVSQRLR